MAAPDGRVFSVRFMFNLLCGQRGIKAMSEIYKKRAAVTMEVGASVKLN
jgi:hypothetical protein